MSAPTPASASRASSSPRRKASLSNCWRKEVFMGGGKLTADEGKRRRSTAPSGASRASLTLVVARIAAAAAQEEARHRLCQPTALVPFGGVQLGQRAVQELLRQSARERVQHGVDVLAAREQLSGARD